MSDTPPSAEEHRPQPELSGDDLAELKGPLEHLKMSQGVWRLLLDSTKELAILFLDPDGRIASLNEGAGRLLGYEAKEILGQPLSRMFLPEDIARGLPEDVLRRAESERWAARDHWLLSKDGTRLWASGITTAFMDASGKLLGFAMVVRDLSRSKETEEILLAEKERLELLIGSVADHAIVMLDPEGKVESSNPAAERITGYRAQELLGKPLGLFYPPEKVSRGLPERLLRQAREKGRSRDEGWILRKDGSRFWAEVTLGPIASSGGTFRGYSAVVHDFTDRKQSEDALRRSQEHFKLLVEAVEEYAIVMLDAEGRVASWNPGAQRILGYTAGEIVGMSVLRFYPAEDIRSGFPEKELQKARKEGQALDERWLIRKDGTRFWASGATRALKDRTGHAGGFVKIFRDLTERKTYEEEIERLNTSLESRVTERTLQLEAFTHTVSHDLRTPLRAMSSFSDLLLREHGDRLNDAGREYARRIQEAAGKMDALIRDLLEYSRLTRAEFIPEVIELDPLVDDLVSEMAPHLRDVKADLTVERPLGRVKGHGATVKQVIYNLVANAVKFVPEGVTPRVRIRTEERGGFVRIWVEDNGIGIDAEHHEGVFKIFERLHPTRYAGTGIGLAIIKKGIERMGGRVGVESAPGQGCKFWIELPKPEAGEPLPPS